MKATQFLHLLAFRVSVSTPNQLFLPLAILNNYLTNINKKGLESELTLKYKRQIKMNNRYFLFLLITLTAKTYGQQWKWDTALISPQTVKITTDLQKNFYTYSDDNVVTKYNSNSKLIWQKKYHGLKIKRLVCSGSDDIYIAGLFKDSLNISEQKIKSVGGGDIFIAKLKANGTVFFINSIGSKSNDDINDISVNLNNDVFITGTTFDTTYFSGGGEFPKNFNGDMFIAKYDLYGNFKLAKFASLINQYSLSNSGSAGLELEADNNGNVLILTEISGRVKIDTNILTDYNSTYILAFNSMLELIWRKKIENDYFTEVSNLALDSKNNIIYTTHDFGQQGSGASIVKIFLNQPLTTQYRIKFYGDINGINVLSSDNIAFTGSREKWDYNGIRPTVFYLVTGELNINTELIWMKQDSSLKYRCGFGIAELADNKYLVAGTFLDTLVLKDKLVAPEFNQFLAFLNPNAKTIKGQSRLSPRKNNLFIQYYPDYSSGKYSLVSNENNNYKKSNAFNFGGRPRKRRLIID